MNDLMRLREVRERTGDELRRSLDALADAIETASSLRLELVTGLYRFRPEPKPVQKGRWWRGCGGRADVGRTSGDGEGDDRAAR